MKSFKIALLAALMVAALVITAGCAGETGKEEPTTTTTAAEVKATTFKAGNWDNDGNIYTFEADGKSGSVEYADGMGGVPFEYEINADGSAVFHMGSVDDNTPATVKFTDENNATITWEDGKAVELTFAE